MKPSNQRLPFRSGDEAEEKDDYYRSQHQATSVPTTTTDDLDVHTLFTTSQISLCPKYISKVLFFNDFMIFLEQNQLYLCLYYDYENVTCIHEELIVDICVMNIDYNQILILQENGNISVLFIILQDPQQDTSSPIRKGDHDDMSDLGESKLDHKSSPLIHLRNYSANNKRNNNQQLQENVWQQAHSFRAQSTRKIPTVMQESLKINVTEFGFILTPQMIFANSIYGAPPTGNIGEANPTGIKIQYFGNSSMLVISNQIKCTILQLQVSESDGSITIEQYIDIEDQFLSHSIISSVWISPGFYHILSCNNDSQLTVTIIPKQPEQYQPREEDLKILAFSDKPGSEDYDHTDDHSARSGELPRRKKALYDQRRLSTRHSSWISALSTCTSPTCLYGISGDIDGELILWSFQETDYQFVNTELMIKRQQMRRKERLDFYGDSLALLEEAEEHEMDSLKSASSKNHWQVLWHDKLLCDHHEITMIRLEVYQSSSNHQKEETHYYAYIGNSHGKLIVLQLFSKSYQVLHELYLFSSLGEIAAIHIHFEEKSVTASTGMGYPHYNESLSAPTSFQSPSSHKKTQHQSLPQTITQQRLRVFSAQSSEAVECILHKHIASIIKLLPTLSMDNSDIESLYEMFFAGEGLDFAAPGPEGFSLASASHSMELQSPPLPVNNNSNTFQQQTQPPLPGNNSFAASIRQLQSTLEFPHYQYSRFYQYNRLQQQFQPKTFTASLKAYTVLVEKDMILVSDWIQYLYLYDLFSGQLLHTLEMNATHCNQLACFEYSTSPTAALLGKNKHRVLVLTGYQHGLIGVYELMISPVKLKKQKKQKQKKENQEMSRRTYRPSNASTLQSGRQMGYDLERDEDNNNKINEEDSNEDDDDEDEDNDDVSVGSHTSQQKRGRGLTKEDQDLAVFDLLDDSVNPFERRYSLETEDDLLGVGLGGNESQTASVFTTEPSLAVSVPQQPKGNQNPLQRFHALTGSSSRQYSCQSKLLFSIPAIHCPAAISHFFVASHGNYFVSIHLQKYLFLYSTHPPDNAEQMNHTTATNTTATALSQSRRRSSVATLRAQTQNAANRTATTATTAPVPTSAPPKGFDTRSLILKFYTFGDGLKQITLLQPLYTEDFSHNHHSQSKSTTDSIKPEDQIERLILILQYADRIELFNALTCEVLAKMSLQDTTVEGLLKASYLWYYQRGDAPTAEKKENSNALIGLSIAELSALYTCSYGKGFEKIIMSQPSNLLSLHGHPTSSNWDLLQGTTCFSRITSPLLALWSMKRCSLLRIHFQPQNDSVHLMRIKQFETKPMPTNKYAFLEILGVQSLKIASWIRNHRGIIILSNGYAVIVRF